MVESNPPNFFLNQEVEPKVPDNKDKKPQGGKINKWKKKNNRNQTQPWSMPSEMTKFKGITKDLEGWLFDIGPKKKGMYVNTYKEIFSYIGDIFGIDFQTAIADITPMVSQDFS